MSRCLALLLLLLHLAALPAWAQSGVRDDVNVRVHFSGETVQVDASFTVAATPQECWAVLTDFDHLAKFITNVQSSTVISRSGDKVRVQQKGKAASGLLSFSFDQIREITLLPHESIQSHMLSGNMKKFEGSTQLVPEGGVTRINYHAEAVPTVWIPPILGRAFIERETREQFQQFRGEILRRKHAATSGAPGLNQKAAVALYPS